MNFLEPIYKFFRSIKLAIVLILYLAITSALSTLIPQGEEISYYYANYSPALAWLIESTHFISFFKSILFLFPMVIFSLNLLTCAVDRFVRRLIRKAKKRFGPDIIHIGILMLMIAGLTGLYGRNESMIWLGEGESAQLPGDYVLFLESFEFQKYEDGRPKDWLSQVDVINNEQVIKSHTIEVNRPLKIGRLKVFQNSYSQEFTADIRDHAGNTITIRPGDYYMAGDSIVVFRGVDAGPEAENTASSGCCPAFGYAVFEELSGHPEGEGHAVTAVRRVAVSEKIDEFTIEKLCIWNFTGLQVVEDPSTIPVIISLILIGFGMTLTFAQKIGDKKL